jgi:AAA family ATP:ADP antiporter
MTGALGRLLRRIVDLHEHEVAAVLWSCAYFFFVLSAYYVLRPIRDETGVAGGVDKLAWLFTATLVAMLTVHPLYAALVARLPRRRFVPLIYRFFILNLVIFFLLFRSADPAQSVWIGRVFFIWTSVFNLFVVSVFWSLMADLFRPSQGQRLFGLIAVGGTLGSVLGASITSALSTVLSAASLLLVSALLLEIAARSARALDGEQERLALAASDDAPLAPEKPIGGGVLEGIGDVARSPYLLGIAMFMLLFTITSTFLYFQQADIVGGVLKDRQARTRIFANIDLAVNVVTLVTQLFLTGRLLRWVGVGASLAFLPVLTLVGATILASTPVLSVLVVFQVLRRAGNFAIQRPAREVLYTVLPRTEKYKAKNFNDTFVYRLGDQAGAWSYTLIAWVGAGLSGLALTMVPLSAAWLLLALWLGVRQRRLRDANAIATSAGQRPGATRPLRTSSG